MARETKRASPDYALECPDCKIGWVYYRQKTNELVCRKCGKVWKANFVDPPRGKEVKHL